jgi:hypothetical protein
VIEDTRRGWNKRFVEHTKEALKGDGDTRRLFPKKLEELLRAHMNKRANKAASGGGLIGIVSAICAVGLDEDAAMDTEEYLVDKYSLSSKHDAGLNMIPGGKEGIKRLHELVQVNDRSLVDTDDREEILDDYLKQHPNLGAPKPGIAEKWNDPSYAEAVICGRDNRLPADQVREIRYLSAMGNDEGVIKRLVGAIDNDQIKRVLSGRTFSRIM